MPEYLVQAHSVHRTPPVTVILKADDLVAAKKKFFKRCVGQFAKKRMFSNRSEVAMVTGIETICLPRIPGVAVKV